MAVPNAANDLRQEFPLLFTSLVAGSMFEEQADHQKASTGGDVERDHGGGGVPTAKILRGQQII